jgi:hypothetical protein
LLFGQKQTVSQQAIEDLVEEIAQSIEGDADYTQITDDLYYFLETPLNLNNATEESLEKLRFLNDFQIKNLLSYLKSHGEMVTFYELQWVEGFDLATIKKLMPFISIEPKIEAQKWNANKALDYGNHTIFSRLSAVIEPQQGFKNVPDSIANLSPNNYYKGNQARVYTRYKFNYKNTLQWGITAEKDPGEQFLNGAQPYGFDFYSAHLQVNKLGVMKTAVVGDYQAQFGQGLIIWSGMGSGKSSYVMDIRKRGKGIHRYSSTDENAFLRGGGITLAKSGFEFTVFGSYKNIDANIPLIDTLNEDFYFSSLINTGIHATPAEIEDKDAIKETVYGSNLNWQNKNFKIGVSSLAYEYNIPFSSDNTPENKYRFNGKSNSNFSTDAEFKFKALHIFTEAALSENGGKAFLAGALMELSSQIRTSVLYRNYQKEYQALYAGAFAEGPRVQNEQGFYMGIEMNPVKKWKLAGYYDFYEFPWITSHADSPSKGNDFLAQADFTVSRTVSMYWRYKHEAKEGNVVNNEQGITGLTPTEKTSIRYHISYVPLENWELRNRIEYSLYNNQQSEKEEGFMLFQDVIYRTPQFPLSIVLRYAVFNTDSYNTRIYTYESDVLNAYSVPPLYDKGTRMYLMLQYKMGENLDFWLRYAQTKYINKTEIGSGLNLIEGDTKTEVKFQLRWKF